MKFGTLVRNLRHVLILQKVHEFLEFCCCIHFPTDATPTPGDVRLLGDARDGVGAVEFYQQTFGWTGICADLFSDDDWLANTEAATIVCRQLGFEEGITYIEE